MIDQKEIEVIRNNLDTYNNSGFREDAQEALDVIIQALPGLLDEIQRLKQAALDEGISACIKLSAEHREKIASLEAELEAARAKALDEAIELDMPDGFEFADTCCLDAVETYRDLIIALKDAKTS